jgi:hypothetical protein
VVTAAGCGISNPSPGLLPFDDNADLMHSDFGSAKPMSYRKGSRPSDVIRGGKDMRPLLIAVVATTCLTGAAVAQTAAPDTIPHQIGNRANGFSYQPTPGEVVPREQAAGVRPPRAAQAATDQELEAIDRDLLRDEGTGNARVPKFTTR